MASKHTKNWGLNQWEPEDGVVHTDFNEDNQKIEAALNKLGGIISVGLVPGYDGLQDVTVDLGRQPAFVAIFGKVGFKSYYDNVYPGHAVAVPGAPGYCDMGGQSLSTRKALEVTETGFTAFTNGVGTVWAPYYYLAVFNPEG